MRSNLWRGVVALILGTTGVIVACGSDGSEFDENANPDGGGSSGVPPLGSTDGAPNDNRNNEDGGFNACLTLRDPAQRLPADLFLMVDTSGSMAFQATSGKSKWSAVRTALETFVSSPDSNGIGVALDYFPHHESGLAQSCATSAECSGAKCAKKYCDNGGGDVLCDSDADCQGGSCVPLGVCQNDQHFKCNLPDLLCRIRPQFIKCGQLGSPCQAPGGDLNDPNGFPLGNCVQPTRSTCGLIPEDTCELAQYTSPEVPFGLLPANATAIKGKLAAFFPNGSTPTHVSLSGAVSAATTHKKNNASHVVAVVYATDGKPEGCDPKDQAAIAKVAADAFKAKDQVLTFVIGVTTPAESADLKPMLDAIASAGSGNKTKPFIIKAGANTSQDFLAALNAIRTATFSCTYALPKPEAGIPDYSKVNVELEAGNGTKTIQQYVQTESSCHATTGGWYYDVVPGADGATPGSVILCPATCNKLKADPNAKLNIVQGCVTNVDPPVVTK